MVNTDTTKTNIYLVLPRYYKCNLEYDKFGNSDCRNQSVYCDTITDRNYCLYCCRNGYANFEIIEDSIVSFSNHNTMRTEQGYQIQKVLKDLRYPTIGYDAFWDLKQAKACFKNNQARMMIASI